MSVMVGGTGIIGQDMVCGFSNGKYTQFEGTEISIENCLKAKVKDLVVEGKTYQNLCIEDTSNEKSSLNFSNYSMFKIGTYYTIILEITVDNASQINLAFNTSHVLVSSKGRNKGIYKFKVRNTNASLREISSVRLISLSQDGYTTCLFKNVIVLEGDYTNIDLPNSINGIESVSERENNILSVEINDNTTTLNLPIPLRSLPNGTCDTIEGDKLVQRVGKVVLDGIDNIVTKHMHTNSLYLCVVYTNYTFNNDTSVSNLVVDGFIPVNSKNIMIPVATENSSYTGINKRNGSNYGIFIRVPISFTSTADEFNTYLQQNPMTVYYPLADPVIHSLEIPQLATTKGTNIITTTNNIKPKLSMKVKVK